MENTLILIIAAILGLIIGSFLNVIIYRFPLMLQKQWRTQCLELLQLPPEPSAKTFNLSFPRSHCSHCQTPIKFWENIPLISFLILKGKCRYCGNKISWRYPAVELICGFLTAFTLQHFGFNTEACAALIFTWILLILFFIDLKHLFLPDEITLGLLWLGLIASCFRWFTNSTDAIIGAVSAYIFLWLIGFLFKKIRGIEGIGYGDYKLLAAFGAWLGWQMLPFIILIASLLGLIIGLGLLFRKKIHRHTPIPFGPFLAIAGWFTLFYAKNLVDVYLQLFGNLQ